MTSVLFVTPEIAPWIKTGGLGDVAGALPTAMRGAGVDVNESAIFAAKARVPRGLFAATGARHLPFPDGSYGLVFTCGLLIHVPTEDLPATMDEMYRVSQKYLMVIEYDATHETMIEYRGRMNALWKRPYRHLFEDRFALTYIEGGFLARPAFDDCTYHLWEKR